MIHESVSIVSPVYNDMKSIVRVLPRLVTLADAQCKKWEIVLIDDRSTDGSREWVKRYVKSHHHIRLFLHDTNRGIAETYRELYRRARNDIVVLFSLDGGWDSGDVLRLTSAVSEGQYDMVVGVRQQKSYTLWRAVVSFLYNILTFVFFGVITKDAGSIKAFRRDIARIRLVSQGVFDEAERIIRAKKKGYRIGYISVKHMTGIKKIRGIRALHVWIAIVDCWRVWKNMNLK